MQPLLSYSNVPGNDIRILQTNKNGADIKRIEVQTLASGFLKLSSFCKVSKTRISTDSDSQSRRTKISLLPIVLVIFPFPSSMDHRIVQSHYSS